MPKTEQARARYPREPLGVALRVEFAHGGAKLFYPIDESLVAKVVGNFFYVIGEPLQFVLHRHHLQQPG